MQSTLASDRFEDLRVLVLTKRQYMSRDLIDDRYGRFRELPRALSALGATVAGLCLSYGSRAEGSFADGVGVECVDWTSCNWPRILDPRNGGYWKQLDAIARQLNPNVIWACSDVPHLWLGTRASNRLGASLVVDLYDNFEAYPLSRVPGSNSLLSSCVRQAAAATCVSSRLARMIQGQYRQPIVSVIENAIPAEQFKPRDKRDSRNMFHLPQDALLIGTAGALSKTRGTDQLIEAFHRIAQAHSNAHLVLAGPLDRGITIPQSSRIHYLGMLKPEQIPALLPALDISVISNRDSSFGRYCFPQKLYESVACGVPVAVADVGAMSDLLIDDQQNLYQVDDVNSMVHTLLSLARNPVVPRLEIPTWHLLGQKLASTLRYAAGASTFVQTKT